MLTCNDKDCKYLTEKFFYKRDQLYKDILDKSYTIYPKKDSEILQESTLNPSIFHINGTYEATLKISILTKLLEDLAKTAEEAVCKQNNITTSPNCCR
ncbi:17995_t:CDS:1, partial [Dentiscutata erythropus]